MQGFQVSIFLAAVMPLGSASLSQHVNLGRTWDSIIQDKRMSWTEASFVASLFGHFEGVEL